MGRLSQLGLGLAKTREGLLGSIRRLLPGGRKITPELCEELEAALLAADVGAASASLLMEAVRDLVRQTGAADASSPRRLRSYGSRWRWRAMLIHRERQHIRRAILFPVTPVERAHAPVGDQQQAQFR